MSVGARNTYRLTNNKLTQLFPQLQSDFSNRAFMVQPFIQNIVQEGEFSVFFFGSQYSHTVLKTPKPHDFRVQEEHGGILRSVFPEQDLLSMTHEIIDILSPKTFYVRADFVRFQDRFALMELEAY